MTCFESVRGIVLVESSPSSASLSHVAVLVGAIQVVLTTLLSIGQHLEKIIKENIVSDKFSTILINYPTTLANPASVSHNLTANAFPMALNASPAPGALFLSGWNCSASFR
jgi:hypothetical protein